MSTPVGEHGPTVGFVTGDVAGDGGEVAQLVGAQERLAGFPARLEQDLGLADQPAPFVDLTHGPRQQAAQVELDGRSGRGVGRAFHDLLDGAHGPHADLGAGVGAVVDDPFGLQGHRAEHPVPAAVACRHELEEGIEQRQRLAVMLSRSRPGATPRTTRRSPRRRRVRPPARSGARPRRAGPPRPSTRAA